uniref:Uncharacterized protein n=1 Tax=Cacopsylla melanoneura TaxID=428564 RepID=A0A8D9EII5_9HEMI
MHFWIDKSRFGGHPCAFNGANRHRPLGSARRWHSPKPNVAPVHRFTSVESIHSPPHHHTHLPTRHQNESNSQTTHPAYTSGQISIPSRIINIDEDTDEDNINNIYIHDMTYTGGVRTIRTPRNRDMKTFGILTSWMLFVFLLIAYSKVYLDKQRGGYEMVVVISMFGLFFVIWHLVYRHSSSLTAGTLSTTPSHSPPHSTHEPSTAHLISSGIGRTGDLDEITPMSPLPPSSIATIPPPPYHIAVLLPTDPKDLPPPSYDLAVGVAEKKEKATV